MTMSPGAKGFDTVAARIAKSEGVPMNVAQGLLSGKLKYPPGDKAAKAKAQQQAANRLLKKTHHKASKKKGQIPPQFLKHKAHKGQIPPQFLKNKGAAPQAPNFPQAPDNSTRNAGNKSFPFSKPGQFPKGHP